MLKLKSPAKKILGSVPLKSETVLDWIRSPNRIVLERCQFLSFSLYNLTAPLEMSFCNYLGFGVPISVSGTVTDKCHSGPTFASIMGTTLINFTSLCMNGCMSVFSYFCYFMICTMIFWSLSLSSSWSRSFSFDCNEEAVILNLVYFRIASTFGSTDPSSSTDDDHKNHRIYRCK